MILSVCSPTEDLLLSFLLWDKHQQAVVFDGVDDSVCYAAWVCLRVSLFEVETLEQHCGQLLGLLGRLQRSNRGQESLFYVRGSGSLTHREPQSSTDPVLLVDVLSNFFQLFVKNQRPTRTRPPLHVDGCGEEAVDHDVGVATDG